MPFAVLLRPTQRGLGDLAAQLVSQRLVVREAGLRLGAFAVEFGGESGRGHAKAPINAKIPPALNVGQPGCLPCDLTRMANPRISQTAPMAASAPAGMPGQATTTPNSTMNRLVRCH